MKAKETLQSKEKKGKKVRALVPVVHNLLFVRACPSDVQRVKSQVAYLQYITDTRSGQKIIVPDVQMQRFIAVAGTYNDHLLYFQPEELNLSKGTKVRITGGDFAGQEGIFLKVKGARDRRVVIEIQGVIAVALATVHPDLIEVVS
jgi:transcription antitermination factor NusG